MIGEVMIILAQVSWAFGALLTKKLAKDINPVVVTGVIAIIGTVCVLPFLIYFSKDLKLFTGAKVWWAIAPGLLWIATGEVMYVFGLSKTSLSHAAVLALAFPLFATTLAIVFLGETLNLKFIVASLFMIVGYVILVI